MQTRLEDYQIVAHVILPQTSARIKFDIFDRQLFKDGEQYVYQNDINDLLGLVMEHLNKFEYYKIKSITEITIKALEQAEFYLGVSAFRFIDIDENGKIRKNPINMNLFENILIAMTYLPYKSDKIKDAVKSKIDEIKADYNFRKSTQTNRDSKTKVKNRHEKIMRMVNEFND